MDVLMEFLIVAAKTLGLLMIGQVVIFQLVTKGLLLVQRCLAAAFYAQPQFAHLKYVTPELLQQMAALVQHGPTLLAARDHVSNTHKGRFLDRLDAAFACAIGVARLTPDQSQTLRAAFGASVPDHRTDPEARAAFDKRHASNDDTLIDEFVKDYIAGDWAWQLRKDLNDANGGGLEQ
jgi:hypothetical protein